jgi:hypothetical protein
MNIFFVDQDPRIAARCLVDTHVSKMLLESVQLLSTAHRVADGYPETVTNKAGRKTTLYHLKSAKRNWLLYKAFYPSHPSNMWIRKNSVNYEWLWQHALELSFEFARRFGRSHASSLLLPHLMTPPENVLTTSRYSEVIMNREDLAMPDKFKKLSAGKIDPVASYRAYYNVEKKPLHKWTNAPTPAWVE